MRKPASNFSGASLSGCKSPKVAAIVASDSKTPVEERPAFQRWALLCQAMDPRTTDDKDPVWEKLDAACKAHPAEMVSHLVAAQSHGHFRAWAQKHRHRIHTMFFRGREHDKVYRYHEFEVPESSLRYNGPLPYVVGVGRGERYREWTSHSRERDPQHDKEGFPVGDQQLVHGVQTYVDLQQVGAVQTVATQGDWKSDGTRSLQQSNLNTGVGGVGSSWYDSVNFPLGNALDMYYTVTLNASSAASAFLAQFRFFKLDRCEFVWEPEHTHSEQPKLDDRYGSGLVYTTGKELYQDSAVSSTSIAPVENTKARWWFRISSDPATIFTPESNNFKSGNELTSVALWDWIPSQDYKLRDDTFSFSLNERIDIRFKPKVMKPEGAFISGTGWNYSLVDGGDPWIPTYQFDGVVWPPAAAPTTTRSFSTIYLGMRWWREGFRPLMNPTPGSIVTAEGPNLWNYPAGYKTWRKTVTYIFKTKDYLPSLLDSLPEDLEKGAVLAYQLADQAAARALEDATEKELRREAAEKLKKDHDDDKDMVIVPLRSLSVSGKEEKASVPVSLRLPSSSSSSSSSSSGVPVRVPSSAAPFQPALPVPARRLPSPSRGFSSSSSRGAL